MIIITTTPYTKQPKLQVAKIEPTTLLNDLPVVKKWPSHGLQEDEGSMH